MRLGGEVRCQGHMTLKFSQLHPPWLCSWFEFPHRTNMHILSLHFQGLKGKEGGRRPVFLQTVKEKSRDSPDWITFGQGSLSAPHLCPGKYY